MNALVASRFQFEHPWRRVTEQRRYEEVKTLILALILSVASAAITFGQTAGSQLAQGSGSGGDWPPCFFHTDTNRPPSGESIYSHLHYDKTISPQCLNLVADFLGRSRDHIQGLLTEMPPDLKTNHDLLLSRTHALQSNWSNFLEIAARPEMDQQLFTKCLTQAEIDRKKYPYGSGGEAMLSVLARNPATPAHFLETLSKSDSYGIQANLVRNPSLATNLLWEILAKAKRNNLNGIVGAAKVGLASNPTTPKELLAEFAKDPDRQIRAATARNTNAPTEILEMLSNDPEGEVKLAASLGLARSPTTPINRLNDLASDSRDFVRAAVARNPITPRPLVEKLLTNDHYEVWTAAFRVLAEQQHPPKELLLRRWHRAASVDKRGVLREGGLPDWLQAEISNNPQ